MGRRTRASQIGLPGGCQLCFCMTFEKTHDGSPDSILLLLAILEERQIWRVRSNEREG
jgi:hypothetical protein